MKNMTKKTKCYNCEKKFQEADLTIIEDNHYCEDCRNEVAFYCEECRSFYITDNNNSVYTHNGNTICESCYDNHYFTCNDCEEVFSNDDKNDVANGDISVCGSCVEHYFHCAECEGYYHEDESNYCEPCDNSYCNGCYDNHDCTDSEFCEQEANLEFTKGKNKKLISNYRFVSCEIEAEEGDHHSIELNDNFSIKEDGSLHNGVEITLAPSSGSVYLDRVNTACKVLTDTGHVINRSCGLHVHIDLRDKKTDYVFLSHLLTTFYAIEDVLFATQPQSRQDNTYCMSLRKNYSFFDFYQRKTYDFDFNYYNMPKDQKEDMDRFKLDHYNSKRYNAFNFHSVFYRGTIEIRLHAGSLNPIKIVRWTNLLLKIVKWVETSYSYKTTLKLLSKDVNNDKLAIFRRVFKIDKSLYRYLLARINQFDHKGLAIPYKLGDIPKKAKKQTYNICAV